MRHYPLPLGGTTTDPDEYAAAKEAIGVPLAEATGMRLTGYSNAGVWLAWSDHDFCRDTESAHIPWSSALRIIDFARAAGAIK
jgi:hypothetical protein